METPEMGGKPFKITLNRAAYSGTMENTERCIQWLLDNHSNILGRPWEEYDIEGHNGLKSWINLRVWSLFHSMKWGNDVLKALIEWYSMQENYEECRKIQLVIDKEYEQLMEYENKINDKWKQKMIENGTR